MLWREKAFLEFYSKCESVSKMDNELLESPSYQNTSSRFFFRWKNINSMHFYCTAPFLPFVKKMSLNWEVKKMSKKAKRTGGMCFPWQFQGNWWIFFLILRVLGYHCAKKRTRSRPPAALCDLLFGVVNGVQGRHVHALAEKHVAIRLLYDPWSLDALVAGIVRVVVETLPRSGTRLENKVTPT